MDRNECYKFTSLTFILNRTIADFCSLFPAIDFSSSFTPLFPSFVVFWENNVKNILNAKKLNKKWFAPAAHLLIIDAIRGSTAVSIGMIKPYPFWAIIFRWILYEFCFLHNRTINLRWGRIFLRNALFCLALSWEK